MNIQEAMKYQTAVIASAKDWINGNSSIGGPEELILIADHYNISLPPCFKNFVYAESPIKFTATGAHKTIGKVLSRLTHKIKASKEGEGVRL